MNQALVAAIPTKLTISSKPTKLIDATKLIKPTKQKKRARKTTKTSEKKVKTGSGLAFAPPSSFSIHGILFGFHAAGGVIHSFLDLGSLTSLMASCQAGRFRQKSNMPWAAVIAGHGLAPPALLKPLPHSKILNRAPTVASRNTFNHVKKTLGGCLSLKVGDVWIRSPLVKGGSEKLGERIGQQIEACNREEVKIAELEMRLETARNRKIWLDQELTKMEKAVPLAKLMEDAKAASTSVNRALRLQREAKKKLKQKAMLPLPLPLAPPPLVPQQELTVPSDFEKMLEEMKFDGFDLDDGLMDNLPVVIDLTI